MPKPSNDQKQRAQLLRERAKKRVQPVGSLSMREAAQKAGLNNETFTRFMNGRTPNAENLNQIEAWLENGSATRDKDAEPLNEWGLARARAIERLVELLGKDQRVLELRAEAALNASIAARLEAEKAPDLSTVSSGPTAEDVAKAAAEMVRLEREAAGVPATSTSPAGTKEATGRESTHSAGSV